MSGNNSDSSIDQSKSDCEIDQIRPSEIEAKAEENSSDQYGYLVSKIMGSANVVSNYTSEGLKSVMSNASATATTIQETLAPGIQYTTDSLAAGYETVGTTTKNLYNSISVPEPIAPIIESTNKKISQLWSAISSTFAGSNKTQ